MPTILMDTTDAREHILEQSRRLHRIMDTARELAEDPAASAEEIATVIATLNAMAYAASGAINVVRVEETRQ